MELNNKSSFLPLCIVTKTRGLNFYCESRVNIMRINAKNFKNANLMTVTVKK